MKADGIRFVRNQLLQHPEKGNSLVFEENWSFGHPGIGPQIKPFRFSSPDHFQDAGLFVNAGEFRSQFNNALERLLGASSTTR